MIRFQVTGYGENGTGDANDVWRVEVVGGAEGDKIETVTSKIKFHHYFLKVKLWETVTLFMDCIKWDKSYILCDCNE